MKERRQNGGRRRQIVQDYLKSIDNNTERLVCFLYQSNYEDGEICRELKIKRKQLKEIKASIRQKLFQAGIRIAEN